MKRETMDNIDDTLPAHTVRCVFIDSYQLLLCSHMSGSNEAPARFALKLQMSAPIAPDSFVATLRPTKTIDRLNAAAATDNFGSTSA